VKWIVIVVGGIIVIGIVAPLIGSRLSKTHRASIAKTFAVPADVIWATITNVDAFPTWRAGIARVERLPDRNGYPV